jgi:uncharacterized membrane protein YdbT with pleckstrin-like domain
MEEQSRKEKAAAFLAEQSKRLSSEAHERTMGYIAAALGLVAGLAWNDAISTLITQLFPLDRGNLIAKFVYAVIITAVVIFATTIIVRPKKEEQ